MIPMQFLAMAGAPAQAGQGFGAPAQAGQGFGAPEPRTTPSRLTPTRLALFAIPIVLAVAIVSQAVISHRNTRSARLTNDVAAGAALDTWWKGLPARAPTVRGFSVNGETVTINTTLAHAASDVAHAQDICTLFQGFVSAEENRGFGLQNVEVFGVDGELLSYRPRVGTI